MSTFYKVLFVLILSATTLASQEIIYVDFDEKGICTVLYKVEKGEGLFSASRKFLTPLQEIYSYNKLTSESPLNPGQQVKIPLDLTVLFTGASLSGYKFGEFIPVKYKVKSKETLFRIARVYCKQSIEDFVKRNDMLSHELAVGQEVVIGWLPKDGNQKILYTQSTDTSEMDTTIRLATIHSSPKPVIKTRGIAYWDKSLQSSGMRYALHSNAKINSEIELFNPLLRRTTTAKVIGRIPVGTYESNVTIVVSPATAATLGALDSKFMVDIRYAQP